jgi:hypothetical protein
VGQQNMGTVTQSNASYTCGKKHPFGTGRRLYHNGGASRRTVVLVLVKDGRSSIQLGVRPR